MSASGRRPMRHVPGPSAGYSCAKTSSGEGESAGPNPLHRLEREHQAHVAGGSSEDIVASAPEQAPFTVSDCSGRECRRRRRAGMRDSVIGSTSALTGSATTKGAQHSWVRLQVATTRTAVIAAPSLAIGHPGGPRAQRALHAGRRSARALEDVLSMSGADDRLVTGQARRRIPRVRMIRAHQKLTQVGVFDE